MFILCYCYVAFEKPICKYFINKDVNIVCKKKLVIWKNIYIEGKTKNAFSIFVGYPCEMEDFLRVNPSLHIPNFLQFSDYTSTELAEITNKILLIYEMRYPHGVLDIFVDCLISLPKEIGAKWNGGLCSLLLDYIQNE